MADKKYLYLQFVGGGGRFWTSGTDLGRKGYWSWAGTGRYKRLYYYTMNFMQGQGLAKSRSHAHV